MISSTFLPTISEGAFTFAGSAAAAGAAEAAAAGAAGAEVAAGRVAGAGVALWSVRESASSGNAENTH